MGFHLSRLGGRVLGALVAHGGEIGVEIGVEMGNLGDVTVEFLNERDVLDHIVGDPGLMVLVHLLNQEAVAVQHRLHLTEAAVESGPHLWVSFFGVLHLAGGGADGVGGGGGGMVVVAVGLLVVAAESGFFHARFGGGGRGIKGGHVRAGRLRGRKRWV